MFDALQMKVLIVVAQCIKVYQNGYVNECEFQRTYTRGNLLKFFKNYGLEMGLDSVTVCYGEDSKMGWEAEIA